MSKESQQFPVRMVKAYNILIEKIDEKIDQSEETIKISCDHIANEEKIRIKRLEKIKKEVYIRRKNMQKDIVTG